MSKAKFAAAAAAPTPSGSSSLSFAQGFLLGQLTLALILFFFIKFFLFGDAPPTSSTQSTRLRLRPRTLSLRRSRSAPALRPSSAPALTTDKILEKTYYNVSNHQPESLDWFNVLIAQTIAQLRADALDGDAVLSSLTRVLNGGSKPDFLDEIKVTEISLGEEFPIFSNCRVIPVDEDGNVVSSNAPNLSTKRAFEHALRDSRLQARMDVDLSDVVTLGIETKLVLNYPKPFVAVLPVALSVSVVRFSGTLSLSFTPSTSPPTAPSSPSSSTTTNTPGHSPTTLQFTFLSDYRLDLAVHSLIGSRSRLQDVPKIAQLVEQRLHAWFDERCVEPRFQQIVLPSLWPRKKNVRGGDSEGAPDIDADGLGSAIDDADLLSPAPVAVHTNGNSATTTSTSAKSPAPQAQTAVDVAGLRRRPNGPRAAPSTPVVDGAGYDDQQPQSGGTRNSVDELTLAGADMRAAEARSRARELAARRGG